MIGKLKQIIAYGEKNKITELFQVELFAGKGVPGDRHCDDDRNSISLWFKPQEKDSTKKGLCTFRFKANLIIAPWGSEESKHDLAVGESLHIGEAILTVTKKKPCYDGCPLLHSDDPCGLKNNVYFVSTARGGMIKTGDGVEK